MEVPKGEWRCHTCVTNAVKSVSTDFGFVDSQQIFNLNTFGDWANTFKQQYFKEIPTVREFVLLKLILFRRSLN